MAHIVNTQPYASSHGHYRLASLKPWRGKKLSPVYRATASIRGWCQAIKFLEASVECPCRRMPKLTQTHEVRGCLSLWMRVFPVSFLVMNSLLLFFTLPQMLMGLCPPSYLPGPQYSHNIHTWARSLDNNRSKQGIPAVVVIVMPKSNHAFDDLKRLIRLDFPLT